MTDTPWERHGNTLTKKFHFKDFASAMAFINEIARIAQDMDHHPDILLYSYNNVKIDTTTHAERKITAKDIELSQKIDEIFNK